MRVAELASFVYPSSPAIIGSKHIACKHSGELVLSVSFEDYLVKIALLCAVCINKKIPSKLQSKLTLTGKYTYRANRFSITVSIQKTKRTRPVECIPIS